MGIFSLSRFILGATFVVGASPNSAFAIFGFEGAHACPVKPLAKVTSEAMKCYNSAVASLNEAYSAKKSSDAAGNAVMTQSTGAKLDSAGKAASGSGAAQAMQASTAAATSAEIATAARANADKCRSMAKSTTEQNYIQQALSNQFYPCASDLAREGAQNSAGYSSTSGSLMMVSTAMSMMTQMAGDGSSGGDSSGADFGSSGFTADTTTTSVPRPTITTVANGRSAAIADASSNEAFKADLGEAVDLTGASSAADDASKALASNSSEPSLSMLASSSKSSSSDTASSGGSRALASSDAAIETGIAAVGSGDKGKSGMGGAPGFTPFDFSDPNAPSAAKPQEASDAGYLGKTQKKNASLAAMMVQKKKDADAAKEASRTLAMANAAQATSQFKATPKSCADRKWQGKQCQALRADPLLNVN